MRPMVQDGLDLFHIRPLPTKYHCQKLPTIITIHKLTPASRRLLLQNQIRKNPIKYYMLCNLLLKISHFLPQCKFHHLKQIHALIITTSLTQDLQIFAKFLRRTTEFGTMAYSDLIFSQMDTYITSEIILLNVMIRGYAFNGPLERCVLLFDEMPNRGLKPHNYTYPYVLTSCSGLGWYQKGKTIHTQILKSGFLSSYPVSNALFNMYVKMPASFEVGAANGYFVNEARKIFDDMHIRPVELWNRMISGYVSTCDVGSARELVETMPERDVVSWNLIISGYARVGEVARELFERMPEKNVISWTTVMGAYASSGDLGTARRFFKMMPYKNVVSWNSMISSYTKHGKFEEALDLFLQMQSEGVIPDGYTFVSVLSACSNLGALEFGKHIHYLLGALAQFGVVVGTALVELYARCGDVNRAFTLFIKIGRKDVFCWNVMIKSLAVHGRAQDAIRLFFLIQTAGLEPNSFTFTSALFACSHGGFVEEGRRIFDSMDRVHKMSPKVEHFGCLIDLLCRNGQLEEALLLVKDMPFKPDVAIWGALLGGCRVVNDLTLAEKVVEKAAEMEANESGVYVLLSNIHASVGQWPESRGAREKMEQQRVWKKAGSSSVV